MLTRLGAGPGCSWMKRWNDKVTYVPPDPAEQRRLPRWYWWMYGVFMIVVFLLVPLIRPSVPRTAPPARTYESAVRLAGLPLVAYGEAPRGIIAVGGRPRGVIAIGGLAVGVLAIGGLALGGIAFSGLSVGILALGGGALGWWAVGGGAVGYHAFGGLAVGGHAYAGNGVALGYYEASGRQKEKLLGEPPLGR